MRSSRLVFEDDEGAAGSAEDAWLQRPLSMESLEVQGLEFRAFRVRACSKQPRNQNEQLRKH